jgi:hypothetical protein
MTEPATAKVHTMPKREPPPRRHSWNELPVSRLAACEFPDGNARTLRVCNQCGMVKVTVHGGDGSAWREWRTKDGKVWQGKLTPPCLENQNGEAA